MKILRSLTRDILTHMVAVSMVLLVIIFSGRFVKYLAEAAVGDIAADILLPVMFYKLPGFLELIIPLGLFIGILMAYGRLYVESEMVVLSACGVSPQRLAGYTLVSALVTMVIVATLSLFITPLGAARSEALLDDPESSQGLQSLASGRFQTRRGSDMVSYARDIDGDSGVMRSVFLSQREKDDKGRPQMVVTVAEEGEITIDPETGARYFELRRGYRYAGQPGQREFAIARFERFGELLPEPEGGIRTAAPVDARSTRFLMDSRQAEDIAALQWRISLPLMVPIVAIIAMCLSKTDHRRGRYVKMAPAFAIYLAYLMMLANARGDVEEGGGGLLAGVWPVHALFLLVALLMLYGPSLVAAYRHRKNIREQAR